MSGSGESGSWVWVMHWLITALAPTSPAPQAPAPTPTSGYPFPAILDPVQVPAGFYPIEVTQFWRGEYAPGRPLPLHWSIVVRTAARRGNTHEIVGDTDTYATQDRFDVALSETGDWRGAHVVGYVAPDKLDALWTHIALVQVVRGRLSWNCQNWVYEVLRALPNGSEIYTDAATVRLETLQTHMMCLLDAWEMGDI